MENVNESISRLPPYVPGTLIDSLPENSGIAEIVQLACNENPCGPSPRVLSSLSKAQNSITRYPDSDGLRLKQKLSKRLGVSLNHVTLGSGSSGVLDLITRVVLSPNSEAIVDEFCFTAYPVFIYSAYGKMITVPAKDWHIDFSGFLAAITANTRLIFMGLIYDSAELLVRHYH